MSLAAGSVRRPITVLVAVSTVAIFGILAVERLPIELLPDLSYPTITVQTGYPDAAPISVEQFVTRPVEESVGVIPGVREMRSVSRPGLSEVILEFEWDEDMSFAAVEVREKLGTINLPREADPPRVLRFDPSLDPIVRLAVAGDRDLDDLRQLADRWLKPRFEGVKGVAAAKVRGGLEPEVIVEADEAQLAALGITLDDLAAALQAENVNQPGGTLRDMNALFLVRTLHEFDDLDQLRRTVVRETPAGRVRVEDVATVRRGAHDREEMSRLSGREVVELALHREGSANTVEVAAAIRTALTELAEDQPKDLTITVLSDQSRYISAAIEEVVSAALVGGLLAIFVLYFFLRDLTATLIIAVAIPTSVVATFLPMQLASVSLNIMSLGGLALGIGMLVDNSIVVLEAIDRIRAQGASRRDAAIRGAGEVAAAVTASTLTTVAVFLPIVFVKGIAGQLFRDQALTVCFSLLASLLVALTVIPALAATELSFGPRRIAGEAERRPWTLRLGGFELPPVGNGTGIWSRVATVVAGVVRVPILLLVVVATAVWRVLARVFDLAARPVTIANDRVASWYPRVLDRSLSRRGLVLIAAVGLFIASLLLIPQLGTELVPELAQGEFAFQLRLPEGTPLATTAETLDRIERPLLADPRFVRVFSVAGSLPSSASGRRTLGENLAQLDLVLAPGSRKVDQQAAVARVREVLAAFPRVEAELINPSVLALAAPVAVRVFADDLDALDRASSQVATSLVTIPGIADIATTAEPGSPEVRVVLDRERASSLGLSAATVGQALRRKIQGELIGTFREGEERIDIRLRSAERFRDQASEVEDLRLRLADGTAIPVSAVATIEIGRGPAAIHRADGARMAEITAKTRFGDLGAVLTQVRDAVVTVALPDGARAELAGQDRELAVSFQSLRLALGLAVFLVFVVMAAQFESLLHPFVILLSVPLALVGIVGALLLTGTAINVLVLIGTVMLAGIVVNNAIVLVDAINRRRAEGTPLRQAIVAAGAERLRPILMTTLTTVLGLVPMALGLGAGDELRAPLAITVIGGLVTATLLTLIVIPCVYAVFTRGEDLAPADDKSPDQLSHLGLDPEVAS